MASRALSARLRIAVESCVGSIIAVQSRLRRSNSISICSPSVGRNSFAVSMTSALMSVSRGSSGCLRANASRCRVRSAPRSAASSIILAIAASYGTVFDGGDQNLDRSGDDGQDVVEVVRDAAGELADRFHLLGMPDALLGGDLVGEVAEEAVEQDALAALQRGDAELRREFASVAPHAPGARGGSRGSGLARIPGYRARRP